MPVLEVSNARKRFGATHALSGAGFTLGEGEWLALLGPNGAGKTTLIRAVAGRVLLDAGSITLLGERLEREGAGARARDTARAQLNMSRAQLGIVPQDIALWPLLTARENLQAFAALHGVARADIASRAAWALEFTGLEDRADALVKGFSGGMKRRLNIACGVLHRPRVILLDEPTVGVDPQSRQRIWEMLDALRKEGASLLLTTHQLDEAQQVCERIVVIDHGKTIAAGTFDELVARTIGRGRRITLLLDQELGGGDPQWSCAGKSLCCTVADVAAELPALLERMRQSGRRVEDVQVAAPSLQAVFLHLTGTELRE